MDSADSDQIAPPKRLRLGTRSCVECRRRKVRCVFQDTNTICEACTLHNVPCRAQQPTTATRGNKSGPSKEEGGSLALLQKLDQMESMIRQIRGSGKPPTDPGSLSSFDKPNSPGDGLEDGGWQQPSPTTTGTPSSWTSAGGGNLSIRGASDALDMFGHTPLVSLFRDALNLPDDDGKTRLGQEGPLPLRSSLSGPSPLHQSTPPLSPQKWLLSEGCMRAVLDATCFCWAIIPPCSFYESASRSQTTTTELLNRSDVSAVLVDIRAALSSDDAGAAAKALLWMALCLFELPRAWASRYAELTNIQSMIEAYKRQAASLLSVVSENGDDTLQTVEARCLEVKLNVDLGWPRKAWLAARKAVNACLLLGYQRAKLQDQLHEQSLWRIALHTDRETSVILGLPASVSNLNNTLLPLFPKEEQQISPARQILHEIMVLLGTVADHDQARMAQPAPGDHSENGDNSYAKAIELDQRWESCRRIMPAGFWDTKSSAVSGLSPADLYLRQTTKVRFFSLGRHIHLPYALKANKENKYAFSRTACLEASRGLIVAYQTLRHVGGTQWAPCGLLDFESFSAAMAIALTMLQDCAEAQGLPRADLERHCSRQEDDYNLLVALSVSLRHAHLLKGSCTVAQRAADVMDMILPILRGQYQQPCEGGGPSIDYDITIPFFGRLRVTFPTAKIPPSSSLASDASRPDERPTARSTPPLIEFGMPLCNQDLQFNFDSDLELNGEWLTSMDAGVYDWTTMLSPAPK